ncbi:MAG: N-6 DNA methylase [Tannerellaceae bacterium]|nr:N-6 DNA methylase [Tannerellaceae bacterium]
MELRPLEKMLNDFTYNNGFEINRVFEDWLYFIACNFCMNNKPAEWWKYTQEQNQFFHLMMVEWIKIMEKQIQVNEWYDAFGILYEACIASKGHRDNLGQFFTPPHICDLMTLYIGDEKKITGQNISDPTCGSGRNLIAFHVVHPGNYLYAEDIDKKMLSHDSRKHDYSWWSRRSSMA